MMKRVLFSIVLLLPALFAAGQSNPVDDLFDKYAGREGITTITISSRMFSMIAQADFEDDEMSQLMSSLRGIRIMSVSDSLLDNKINFFRELSGKLDYSKYEELMSVNEGGKNLKFYIRQKGQKIEELLMIGGGIDGNVILTIRGDLNMKSIAKISKSIGIDELEGIDQNKTGKKQE